MLSREKIYTITSILFLCLTSVAFQNWNYIDLEGATIVPVNEEIRSAHAKELLGKIYDRKYASKLEDVRDLNQLILDEVRRGLPKKYKKQAARITQTIIEEAEKYELDPVFILAMIKTESQFDPKIEGQFGEIGLMQIKPSTAAWIAPKKNVKYLGPKSLYNPIQNIKLGTAYVAYLRENFDGAASKYLTAYNMGPTRLRQMIAKKVKPKEYATKVMTNYRDFYLGVIEEYKKNSLQAQL